MKKVLIDLFGILVLLQAFSCSLPEVKQAQFERDLDSIVSDLMKIGDFEDAGIQIKARSFNGKTSHVIEVSLINGKQNNNVPLNEVAKEAIGIVVNSISNESDFDKFEVSFVERNSEGFVTSSKGRTIQFTKADLNLGETVI